MKSRKVKATARSKAYMKKLKGTIPIDKEDNSFDENENDSLEEDIISNAAEDSSSEEEVLPITDDERESSEEDANESAKDSEMEDEEEGLPDLNDWGKKKSTYYNADFIDKDRGKSYRDEDLEMENAEREAASLQQETAIELDRFESAAYMEDYDRTVEFISKKLTSKVGEGELEDANNLEIEKLKHESKKYPKLSEYKEKFKEKFTEVNEKLAPLVELCEQLNLDEKLVNYIKLKYQIVLHYLMNINFYLYLKSAENIPENHPIYGRITQFKELDDQMNAHKNYTAEIDNILKIMKENKDFLESFKKMYKPVPLPQKSKEKKSVKKNGVKSKPSISKLCDVDMKEISNVDSQTGFKESKEGLEGYTAENGDEKRTITYQIAKNKGLVTRRKKEMRNPRVHNRMKFRKAKIRRKGQVRQVIKEMKRYAGEPTGISAHVVRSVKLK